jgi:hypothetical protein
MNWLPPARVRSVKNALSGPISGELLQPTFRPGCPLRRVLSLAARTPAMSASVIRG